MRSTEIRREWLDLLATTSAAVDAGAAAHVLAPDAAAAERRLLADERRWVDAVDWRELEARVALPA
jgi:hypothetical protein